jgi:hypothetical protein
MVMHFCNPSTQEAEAGGSWLQSQPEVQSDTLSQQKENEREGKGGVFLSYIESM